MSYPYAGLPDEQAREFVSRLVSISNQTLGYVANHKIFCKNYLSRYNIPLAKTYYTIESLDDLKSFDWDSLPESFVFKGALSNVGNSVRIIKARNGPDFVLEGGQPVTRGELSAFAEKVLRGGFLKHATDPLLFEEKLTSCTEMRPYLKCGMADLRIGYYKLVPIHIRMRLSSSTSGGLSNVCKSTGTLSPMVNIEGITTKTGFFPVDIISETGQDILGIKVPFFGDCLRLGAYVEHLLQLNHTTLDIALTDRGPVLMEAHTGTAVTAWAKEVDLRYLVKRIWAIEKNVKRIRDIDSALTLGREIYTVNKNLDFTEFAKEFTALTGIEVSWT